LGALIERMGIVRDRKTLAVPRVAIMVRDGTDNRRGQITGAVRTLVEPGPLHNDLAVCPCCDPFLVAEEVPGIVLRYEVRRAPCLAPVERSADRNARCGRVPAEHDVGVVSDAVGTKGDDGISRRIDPLERSF